MDYRDPKDNNNSRSLQDVPRNLEGVEGFDMLQRRMYQVAANDWSIQAAPSHPLAESTLIRTLKGLFGPLKEGDTWDNLVTREFKKRRIE